MIFGTQYYRPPFPVSKHWEEDLKNIKKNNINTIQLWVVWAWVEPEIGLFRFEDYDELMELAYKNGLKVILSTLAEIQPYWIHRVYKDSYMIDHMGHKVISSNRSEMNQGLTPGGCTDHPMIKEGIKNFIEKVTNHFSNHPALSGWDCWNELRWQIQADGLVCQCEHTLEKYRSWLEQKYINLDNLNSSWQRRYCSFQDILPPKTSGRTFTEAMEFQRFISYNLTNHLKFRYDLIRNIDKTHIITAHTHMPSIFQQGDDKVYMEYALMRGNDWHLSNEVDTLGCSYFPETNSDIDFATKIECNRSAVKGKPLWISELKAGAANTMFAGMTSYTDKEQQRYLVNSLARGAKAVLLWSWRDEIFGIESGCNGLIGEDDFASSRLEVVRLIGGLIEKYDSVLAEYKLDEPLIGVLFEPDTHYLEWSKAGYSDSAKNSIAGYLTLLEKSGNAYEILETSDLTKLKSLKMLIVPLPLIIKDAVAKSIYDFVNNGGILWIEGEMDTFNSLGFFNYVESRKFALYIGIWQNKLRKNDDETIKLSFSGKNYKLKTSFGIQDFKQHNGEILSKSPNGEALFIKSICGKGKIYAVGTFLGIKYLENPYNDLEKLFENVLLKEEISNNIKVSPLENIQYRTGISGNKRLLFLINSGETKTITVTAGKELFDNVDTVTELLTDTKYSILQSRDGFEMGIEEGNCKIVMWDF